VRLASGFLNGHSNNHSGQFAWVPFGCLEIIPCVLSPCQSPAPSGAGLCAQPQAALCPSVNCLLWCPTQQARESCL